ncbi:MAG: hypothetical protein ACK41W_13870 [Cyanobacteriota bacterium]|jgi:hypothetical protein
MDNDRGLQEVIREGGIESVHFFNGRLLSGQDLSREQAARRRTAERLGVALGTGIVNGLEVRRAPPLADHPLPRVRVDGGLAVNAAGEVLRLDAPETIRLTRVVPPEPTAPLVFKDCTPPLSGTYLSGEGLYLLTLAPASVATGRAATNGLGGTGVACNTDADIAGVQFRLLEIRPRLYADLDLLAPDFRNRIAYRCFGAGVFAEWVDGLLAGGSRGDDLLLAMTEYGLTPHDVPLALIGFTGVADLALLDADAVRRPLARPDPPGYQDPPGYGVALSSLAAPRRLAVGRAMMRQFAGHWDDLTAAEGALASLKARDLFPYLPPVGVLPHADGAAAKAFFAGMAVRGPLHINAQQVEALVAESLTTPAIRVRDGELIWLYTVAGNRLSQSLPAGDPGRSDPYTIFASGHLAYRADARFNLSRFDVANFALG